jgi:PhnB protein
MVVLMATSVQANIIVDGGLEALRFYGRAFGAETVLRLEHEGRLMHGEMRIGDSLVALGDSMPEHGVAAPDPSGPVPSSLTLWCDDSDALFAQAVAAGATELSPVTDEFHGDRVGSVRCPFGHRWIISTRVEEMDQEEMQRRMEAWLAKAG